MMKRLRSRRMLADDGYTLVELSVTLLIMGILMSAFYTFLFSGERASRDGRQWLELNQTARLSQERMTRELREADQLVSASPSDGTSAVTFQADFNADGTFVNGTYVSHISCDEIISYRYDSANDRLRVSTYIDPTPPTASPSECVPDTAGEETLAEHVSAFSFTYYGSSPYLDNGTSPPTKVSDGVVTWQEIDNASAFGVAGYGNNDGVLNAELASVTSISLQLTVSLRGQSHTYRTAIELRNTFR